MPPWRTRRARFPSGVSIATDENSHHFEPKVNRASAAKLWVSLASLSQTYRELLKMSGGTLTLEEAADYLHLSPQQTTRLAERGQLPGRRLGGQWKFNEAELHHWLEERLGLGDEQALVHVETVAAKAAPHAAETLAELIPFDAIAVPHDARTKASVINDIVQLAAGTGLLWDSDKLKEAVLARESLHSTALDNGVALLHPRRPMASILAQPLVALVRTHQPLAFGDTKGRLTDVFFLICSVDDAGHLRTLSRLTRLLNDAAFLEELRHAESSKAALESILTAEKRLFTSE